VGERDFELYKLLDVGDLVGVEGYLFRTRTGELTLHAERLQFLAKAVLPLPEKWHGLTDVEIRYRQRYLDLMVNEEVRTVFERRGKLVRAIRDFLEAEGYLEVETPMLQPLAGGAMARPFITHHNALDMDLYLRIAPELYLKRLIMKEAVLRYCPSGVDGLTAPQLNDHQAMAYRVPGLNQCLFLNGTATT